MLSYIIVVNKQKDLIVVDYETDDKNCCPDTGYIEECDDWQTNDDDIFFDKNKAFKKTGLYRVEGFDSVTQTPDGNYYNYNVTNITKISDVTY